MPLIWQVLLNHSFLSRVERIADKAQFTRPAEMFGPFSATKRHATKGDRALQLPKHPGSDLPVLPLGMLNVTAKAGTWAEFH